MREIFTSLSLSAKIAFFVLLGIILVAIFAPFIAPYPQDMINMDNTFAPISWDHLLGSDHLGRDIFSRILFGARLSLGSAFIILCGILLLGISVGGACGYLGGWVDKILMRVCDIFLSMPTIVLSLFLVSMLGSGLTNILIAITLTHWAYYARITRSIVFKLKNKEYVLSSRAFGLSAWQNFSRNFLKIILSQCLILASLDLGHVMLHIAGLSFLGLGVSAPNSEWGLMLSDAKDYLWSHPYFMIAPGVALFVSVASCNILGEGLKDILGSKYSIKDKEEI